MNELWAAEVERRLRTIADKITALNQTSLRIEGTENFGFPVTTPPEQTATDEVFWIRLTAKSVIGGVNMYSWRRQIYVMTGGGMAWIDSGEFGTLDVEPAIGLNNEDRSTTDGKRYPAKWNADTSQWIFFLRLSETPPSTDKFIARCRIRQIGGYHFLPGSPYPGGTEYTSPNVPSNLRFVHNLNNPPVEFSNADNSTFMFEWTEIVKTVEAKNGYGETYAQYSVNDAFGNQVAFLRITEKRSGTDQITGYKGSYQYLPVYDVYGNLFKVSFEAAVNSSVGVLRNNTSGTRATGYQFYYYWYMTYTTLTTDVYYGGRTNFEICWGDGCITPVQPPLGPVQTDFSTAARPVAVRMAKSLASNTIKPMTTVSSAVVQFGPTETDSVNVLSEFQATGSAFLVAFPSPEPTQTTITTAATAIAVGSTFPDTTLQTTTTTTLAAITVARAWPNPEATAISATATPIALIAPFPEPAVSTIIATCSIMPVSTVPQTSAESAFGAVATTSPVITVPPINYVWQVTGNLTAIAILAPIPEIAVQTTAATVTPVVVQTAQASVQITFSATCTATTDEIGITPK